MEDLTLEVISCEIYEVLVSLKISYEMATSIRFFDHIPVLNRVESL